MADYVTVTWTSGDILTEAKLDNMVSNDTAENAHPSLRMSEIAEPSTPAANALALFVADASGITKLKVKDPDGNVAFVETVAEVALTDGATIAVDWSDGPFQRVTLGGNRTFTFASPLNGGRYILALKQDGTGSRTATWPATVKWPANTAPTLTTTAAHLDLVGFVYHGNEALYLGFTSLDYTVD